MKDQFTKQWITENSLRIVTKYEKGVLTLRSLYYQLVGLGMTNSVRHYKRVVNSIIDARWDDLVDFDTFSDLDREMVGETLYETTSVEKEMDRSRYSIKYWMENYRKNRWENQEFYPEVFIEKKALQGVFQNVCYTWDVALGACKGYPSLTFLYEAAQRFRKVINWGKTLVILYFGDYDPSGEDIPRSIGENFSRFGVDVEIRRIALMENQVIDWNLPPAPTKDTDSRSAGWDGLGQVELDAVTPEQLNELCKSALEELFDRDLYEDLLSQEEEEREQYRKDMKDFINSL